MNCTRVQALLPLYVGADLAAREAERVRAHLEICAPCRDLAEGFAASTAWSQAAPPPEFDEAFFAALRADVQHAIAQTELNPSWFERWLPVVNWRWAWVPVLALILLAVALNWQRQRALPLAQPNQNLVKKQVPTQATSEQAAPTPAPNHLAFQSEPKRKQARGSGSRRNAVTTRDVAVDRTASVSPELVAAAAEPIPATTPEMMRIEIQTADPNIRIIWLAPKPQDATTPAETPNR